MRVRKAEEEVSSLKLELHVTQGRAKENISLVWDKAMVKIQELKARLLSKEMGYGIVMERAKSAEHQLQLLKDPNVRTEDLNKEIIERLVSFNQLKLIILLY